MSNGTFDGEGRLKVNVGASVSIIKNTAAITIENPTSSEDASIFNVWQDTVIARVVAVVDGTTPSVTWTIRFASSRAAAGTELITGGTTTTSTTTGDVLTVASFDNNVLTAGDFVWLETTAKSGTVSWINVTINY